MPAEICPATEVEEAAVVVVELAERIQPDREHPGATASPEAAIGISAISRGARCQAPVGSSLQAGSTPTRRVSATSANGEQRGSAPGRCPPRRRRPRRREKRTAGPGCWGPARRCRLPATCALPMRAASSRSVPAGARRSRGACRRCWRRSARRYAVVRHRAVGGVVGLLTSHGAP